MLLAMYREKGRTCLLMEQGKRCVSDMSMLQLLEQMCLLGGSTVSGRRQAAKQILHIQQKVPILLSEKETFILFPTRAIKREDCMWIHAAQVRNVQPFQKHSRICFRDDTELIVNAEYRTIRVQLHRCQALQEYLHAFPLLSKSDIIIQTKKG